MDKKTLRFRVEELEKKVAALEGQVQAQPKELNIRPITINSEHPEELLKKISLDPQRQAFG